MGITSILHHAVDALGAMPGVLDLRRARYARRFGVTSLGHAFHGVHPSFEAAARALPPTRPAGYDNAEAAAMYLTRTRLDDYDWPALYWIGRALDAGARRVVDLGGSVGIKFLAFGQLHAFPRDLDWLVIDVPAVAERGGALARARGEEARLRFASDPAAGDGCAVLLASGALQYLPYTLAELLSGWRAPPARVVVNTTPLHESRDFFTLNDIGVAVCPYRVQSRAAFLSGMAAAGYRPVAEWRNPAKAMRLPFERGYDVDAYSGFCFERDRPA